MNPKTYSIILCGIFITISLLVLIHHNPQDLKQPGRLTVVCTTNIIADAVHTLGGDHLHIITLMGPGVDPHTYKAREHDIHALAQADIIFYNGLHLEGKMSEILQTLAAQCTVVAVADSLPRHLLIQSAEFSTVYDPHIWFDVQLWRQVVETISTTLQRIDPTHAATYLERNNNYQQQLATLDTYIHQKVAQLPPEHRILVTAHDAFGYFGKAYGFKVVGLQGISTESEPSMADIQRLVTYIVNHKIPAIFIESSLPRRTIHAVQQAVAMHQWYITVEPELYSDSLGTPGTLTGTYLGMVTYTIEVIVRSLSPVRGE